MNYLEYLKYWKQPQYAKYLVYVAREELAVGILGAVLTPPIVCYVGDRYPHALAFLDMLDDERFRQVGGSLCIAPVAPVVQDSHLLLLALQMIQREDFMTLVHSQQFYHWQTFLNNRSEVPAPAAATATTGDDNEQEATESKQ